MVPVFMALSSMGHDPGGLIVTPIVGGLAAIVFFALADFIELAIDARHDLDDIRSYLSTMSKPRPDSEQPSGDSATQATDEKSE